VQWRWDTHSPGGHGQELCCVIRSVAYGDVRGSVTHVLKRSLSMVCVCRIGADFRAPLLKNRKMVLCQIS